MLPTMRVPYTDQLGMSERLNGARRSALKHQLAHAFLIGVLGQNDSQFITALDRYRQALGKFAHPQPLAGEEQKLEWHILRHALLLPEWNGDGKAEGSCAVGKDETPSVSSQDVSQPTAEAEDAVQWHSPLARLLGIVLHCVSHAVAEGAFLQDDDSTDGRSPVKKNSHTINADDVNSKMGVNAGTFSKNNLYQSTLRAKVGRALQFMVRSSLQDEYDGPAIPSAEETKLSQLTWETYAVFAEALLEKLPDALGQEKIGWQSKQVRNKTQKVLKLNPGIRKKLIEFLQQLPMTLTLQPLLQCPQYGASWDPLAETKARDQVRPVSLLGFRRVNGPLRDFLLGLNADHFDRFVPAIDAQQRVAWRLNKRVLEFAQYLVDLGPSGKETDAQPGLDDSKLASWRIWIAKHMFAPQKAGGKHKILPGEFLRNPLVTSVLDDAFDQTGAPQRFFLPWKADYRGRIYAETPWFTPQGGDLQRALFEFADGDPLDEPGKTALRQHGGNLIKKDVLLHDLNVANRHVTTLSERAQWVESHHHAILACATDPLRHTLWREESITGKPWQFLAFCFAYADAALGNPCHVPVQIDGTCNGLQHIAALTGNLPLAKRVNVCVGTDTDDQETSPADIYSEIADEASLRLKAQMERASGHTYDKLAVIRVLAAHPECFSVEAANAVLESVRRPDELHGVVSLCSEACAGRSAIKPTELAKIVVNRLRTTRRALKKSGQLNVSAADLVEQTIGDCEKSIARAGTANPCLDLLLAEFPDRGKKRYEVLLGRGTVKTIVMTIPYGAGKKSQQKVLAKDLRKLGMGLTVEEVCKLRTWYLQMHPDQTSDPRFDAQWLASHMMAEMIVEQVRAVIRKQFPGVSKFASTLSKIANSAEGLPLMWTSPIGLPVFQDGFKLEQKKTLSVQLSPGNRVQISFVKLLEEVDPEEQRKKLLPNLIHSLDASHLLFSISAMEEAGIQRFGSIHDCLLVHPNDATQAGDIVRAEFARLYKQHSPGQVPIVYKEWLDWMQLLHEVAAFPQRTSLQLAMGSLRPGAIFSTEVDQVVETAQKCNQQKLVEFMSRVHRTDISEQDLSKLNWLLFILKYARPLEIDEKTGKWPAPVTTADSGFDIKLVKQSPYFFS